MGLRSVSFVFIGEGTSDYPLVGILSELVRRAGADEVEGLPRQWPGSSREKLAELTKDTATPFDLVFLHRDADSMDPTPRIEEVRTALTEQGIRGVPVVPVQETEAWLLTDEQAIRDVVGRSRGRAALGLPSVRRIEQTSNPKEILADACVRASEASGRRLKQARGRFNDHRRVLLDRLDLDGPVTELTSFRHLVEDTERAVRSLRG
ncbi:uncharacterized protein DUF4276 [Promicromonospora sp. AC04]|uniref:DUF4276 family protein n=1 Tax=Promicromonospora sp. AC04 TaxID=2135723 RepID=UPI000D36BDCA|nr:DUF4276 family protein [Promicromonospora sp. AC04]PUB21467.1 uncharacterized protein DUF4276 [Promicromonospora sp. AC04]